MLAPRSSLISCTVFRIALMSTSCRLSSTKTGALSCSAVGGLGSSPGFGEVLSLLKIASMAGIALSMMGPTMGTA
ncbi:hypothetical protein BDW59DRAFT_151580 [Aspergillus cavernicola]|uniref:Secreted protein n=1 Tax=Aspergillus cavernicola TaxID=176166 RepID=A0ABR4HV57_9EURO